MNESTKPAVTWSIMKVNKVLYIMILRVGLVYCNINHTTYHKQEEERYYLAAVSSSLEK